MIKTKSIESYLELIGSEKRIHYSLTNFTQALEAAGRPHDNVKTLVISGTNGKGGTTLFLSSALKAEGYRVCTYLSPHLQEVSERFLFNLKPIPHAELNRLAGEAYPYVEKFQLTYFEYLTLIFFIWCRETKPDYVVLEVGMGGKEDATNVTDPVATVLTNISYDHQAYLGDTLEKILEEKMGIFRKKTPIFTSLTDSTLLPLLRQRASELDSKLVEATSDPKVISRDWNGQTIVLDGEKIQIANPSPGAAKNAALAWSVLRECFPQISLQSLKFAFQAARNPGRLEMIQNKPRVILSGDHNLDGISDLEKLLKELKTHPLSIVAGFSLDKPYREMFDRLRPFADKLWLTAIPTARGKLPADYLAMGPVIEDAKDAVQRALKELPAKGMLLVTGSLYLVGEVRSLWESRESISSTD